METGNKFNIPKGQSIGNLVNFYNLTSVRIINSKQRNKFEGKDGLQSTYDRDEPIGVSSLGTPIYTDLTLLGCEYTDNITSKKVSLKNDRFHSGESGQANANNASAGFYMNIETVLMTVEQPIRIIKTEIQGRNGSVKEYIGADDSKITINLVITGKNGVYPREEVKRLKDWLDAPVAKGIVAWWLDNLGISDIVIESYSMPQVQGGYSYQMVSINAISDLPVELKITQPIQ